MGIVTLQPFAYWLQPQKTVFVERFSRTTICPWPAGHRGRSSKWFPTSARLVLEDTTEVPLRLVVSRIMSSDSFRKAEGCAAEGAELVGGRAGVGFALAVGSFTGSEGAAEAGAPEQAEEEDRCPCK